MSGTSNPYDPHDIVVTGDQTIDWVVQRWDDLGVRSADERLHANADLFWHKGGMFLLNSMINAALNQGNGDANHCHCADPPSEDELTAYQTGYNHSFAILGDYKPSKDELFRWNKRGMAAPGTVHRIRSYLGFRKRPKQQPSYTRPLSPQPKVVVVDDADLGYRRSSRNWQDIIPTKQAPKPYPWIILKMSFNIAEGDLWDSLKTRLMDHNDWLKDRLVVLTAIARLRDKSAEISRNLSWDRSVYDTLAEIDKRDELQSLKLSPYLVASFGPSGVLMIRRRPKMRWKLIYRSDSMEGEWASDNNNGMMFGYGSTLCASLVRQLRDDSASRIRELDLSPAVQNGLIAMQNLYDRGFVKPDSNAGNEFTLPAAIFRDIDGAADGLLKPSQTDWESRFDRSSYTSISRRLYDENSYGDRSVPMQVACSGIEVLKARLQDVPIGHFGELYTVDRKEIEGLHSIANLVDGYCDGGRIELGAKPLAISVFGSPGSGKGFAIKELVSPWAARDRKLITHVNFNLSQFHSPSDLVGALHQVRDDSLRGKMPVVLWDEFDTPVDHEELGWLKYFLAPIQDGKFQQGEITHWIGPSIFVFAGGTCKTFEDFRTTASKAKPESKAADFISRIRGFIDIADINPEEDRQRWLRRVHVRSHAEPMPPELMLRRALTLYSLFKINNIALHNGSFVVDPGVLHAFLEVSRYKHGVRSMEAIIKMSRLTTGQTFSRWALPSREQLDLHVDGAEFLKIMRRHHGPANVWL